MKTRTKRKFNKVLCLICAIFILAGTCDSAKLHTYAADILQEHSEKVDRLNSELMEFVIVGSKNHNERTMLINCIISVSCSAEGLHIEITTGSSGYASVLGIKDIVIKQKVWYGWKTIATGSGGEQHNCSIMGLSINYSNVQVGEHYRISCVHYGTQDVYEEGTNDTGSFEFRY